MQKNLKTTKTHMFMNGFILRKFRQVTVLLVLFAAQSLYAQSPSSYLAAYKANNTQKVDRVVWKESNNYIFAHLYRDDTDTTNYNFPVTPRLERSIVSYENSSYMKDGCKRVKQSLLQVMRSLTDAQVKMLQGDKPTKTSPIRLWLLLYKGNVVKTLYTLRGGLKKEGFLESFILDVDSKIRDVKFLGFESYGIQCCNINIFISSKEIQKLYNKSAKESLSKMDDVQPNVTLVEGYSGALLAYSLFQKYMKNNGN